MRAIIIEDKDAKALLKELELIKLRGPSRMLKDNAGVNEAAYNEVHRSFHCVAVRWLQAQGCDLIGGE